MASNRVAVGELAHILIDNLYDYSKLTTDEVKEVIKEAAESARDEISQNAPRSKGRRSGAYAKSWTITSINETATGRSMVVFSKKPNYRLAHLLEFGHAKRGGGRVAAQPHIAPAERRAVRMVEEEIKRRISHG